MCIVIADGCCLPTCIREKAVSAVTLVPNRLNVSRDLVIGGIICGSKGFTLGRGFGSNRFNILCTFVFEFSPLSTSFSVMVMPSKSFRN